MTDIVEQCARAMCIAMGDDPDREGKDVVLTAYHSSARSVLAKFKELTAEPTPAMINASIEAVISQRCDIYTAATEQMWKDIL